MTINNLFNLRFVNFTAPVEKTVKPTTKVPVNVPKTSNSLTGEYNLTGIASKSAFLKNSGSTQSFLTSPVQVKTAAPQTINPIQTVADAPASPGQLNFEESKSVSNIAYDGKQGEVYKFADGTFWRVDKTQDSGGFFSDGFKAVAMRRVVSDGNGGYKDDPTDNRIAVGFAGTDGLNDVNDDIDQALGQTPEQYQDAVNFTSEIQTEASKNCEPVTLTGHSLGGGLASYVSIQTGLPATAINSAPLTNDKVPDNFNDSQITQYFAKGEILTDEDDLNPTDKRPGKHIEVNARYQEESYKWYNFLTVAKDNVKISGQNHSLTNTAPEVTDPKKVYG